MKKQLVTIQRWVNAAKALLEAEQPGMEAIDARIESEVAILQRLALEIRDLENHLDIIVIQLYASGGLESYPDEVSELAGRYKASDALKCEVGSGLDGLIGDLWELNSEGDGDGEGS